MRVPPENWLAAFPPSEKAGNVALGPLTLEGAIRLGREGVDCGAAIPKDQAFAVAFVLSGAKDRRRFLKRAKCGLQELCNAVERVLNTAFATYVKPAAAEGGTESLTPHGVGWPLELAEFLCAEYGWPWREALATPVATAYALVAAARQRQGAKKGGLDYLERLYAADLKSGRAKPVRLG